MSLLERMNKVGLSTAELLSEARLIIREMALEGEDVSLEDACDAVLLSYEEA